MNHTENYQLNQWAKSDRVLMEDFNSDNRKIDAALKEASEASPYVKIKEIVTTTVQNKIDLDVSDVDFTQYWAVMLYCSAASSTDGLTLRVNGLTSDYNYGSTSGGGTSIDKVGYMGSLGGYTVFYPPAKGARVGCCCFYGTNMGNFSGYQYTAPCTWDALKQFNVEGRELPKGTRLSLFGLKK